MLLSFYGGQKPKISEDPLLNKTPPQDLEAEQSILSAVFINNDSLHDILSILAPEDFYKGSHQKIYQAVIDLARKGEPADLITVVNRLKEKGELESIGGGLLSGRHRRCRPSCGQCRSLRQYHQGQILSPAIDQRLIGHYRKMPERSR